MQVLKTYVFAVTEMHKISDRYARFFYFLDGKGAVAAIKGIGFGFMGIRLHQPPPFCTSKNANSHTSDGLALNDDGGSEMLCMRAIDKAELHLRRYLPSSF